MTKLFSTLSMLETITFIRMSVSILERLVVEAVLDALSRAPWKLERNDLFKNANNIMSCCMHNNWPTKSSYPFHNVRKQLWIYSVYNCLRVAWLKRSTTLLKSLATYIWYIRILTLSSSWAFSWRKQHKNGHHSTGDEQQRQAYTHSPQQCLWKLWTGLFGLNSGLLSFWLSWEGLWPVGPGTSRGCSECDTHTHTHRHYNPHAHARWGLISECGAGSAILVGWGTNINFGWSLLTWV